MVEYVPKQPKAPQRDPRAPQRDPSGRQSGTQRRQWHPKGSQRDKIYIHKLPINRPSGRYVIISISIIIVIEIVIIIMIVILRECV